MLELVLLMIILWEHHGILLKVNKYLRTIESDRILRQISNGFISRVYRAKIQNFDYSLFVDCTALELAISEHTLWLLTSHGHVQCRENISLTNPIGTRTINLPGRFNSITGLLRREKKNYF